MEPRTHNPFTSMALLKTIRKGLDTAADWSGATSTVKVGGNLVKNVKNVIQRKPQQPLYDSKTKGSTFAKDLAGIVGLGTALLGGVAGMGAKAGVKAEPAAANGPTLAQNLARLRAETVGKSQKLLDAAEAAMRDLPGFVPGMLNGKKRQQTSNGVMYRK
jgi:hypothetical protein